MRYHMLEVKSCIMVKHAQDAKNPSRAKPEYMFPCYVESYSELPKTTEVRLVEDLKAVGGVEGASGITSIRPTRVT
jgi:hypothetical protein